MENFQSDLTCSSCGKSFPRASNLKRHIHTVHEGHKDYKCDTCDKSFTEGSKLKKHIKRIHENVEIDENIISHKCDTCEKSFPCLSKLKRHTDSVHEGRKDYKCDHCEKFFTEGGSLKRHIKKIHEIFKADITCKLCGKLHTSPKCLEDHILAIHIKGSKNNASESQKKTVHDKLNSNLERDETFSLGRSDIDEGQKNLNKNKLLLHGKNSKNFDQKKLTSLVQSGAITISKNENNINQHFLQQQPLIMDDDGTKKILTKLAIAGNITISRGSNNTTLSSGKQNSKKNQSKMFNKGITISINDKEKFLKPQIKTGNNMKFSKNETHLMNRYFKQTSTKSSTIIKPKLTKSSGISFSKNENNRMNKNFKQSSKIVGIIEQKIEEKPNDLKEIDDKTIQSKRLKCDTCGKSFPRLSNLKRHTNSVHEGRKDYRCNVCDKLFTEGGGLKKHIDSFHPSFYSKKGDDDNAKTIDENRQRSHMCDSCVGLFNLPFLFRFSNFEQF